jgi:hypothetical protein
MITRRSLLFYIVDAHDRERPTSQPLAATVASRTQAKLGRSTWLGSFAVARAPSWEPIELPARMAQNGRADASGGRAAPREHARRSWRAPGE